MPTHQLTRREFLRLSTSVGAGLALGGVSALPGCTSCSLPGPTLPLTPSTAPALVAAERGTDLKEMTRRVLKAIGGIETIVRPGETVFIKPNLLTAGLPRSNHSLTGECTKPEIVIAVAEECLAAGAARVTIGDGAQVERFAWEDPVTLDGSTNLAAEAARLNAEYGERVTLACLNADSPEWDTVPSRRTTLGQIYVSSLVTQADRVISIPVLKTHRYAQMSLSLKNFVGVTPVARYGAYGESLGRFQLHLVPGGVEGCFLDVVEAIRPDLAIIDASIGVEGTGPWVRQGEGRTVDMRERLGDWLVVASTDLVAADATAARITGHDVERVSHIIHAYEQGLGQALAELITIAGPTLEELRVDWQPS